MLVPPMGAHAGTSPSANNRYAMIIVGRLRQDSQSPTDTIYLSRIWYFIRCTGFTNKMYMVSVDSNTKRIWLPQIGYLNDARDALTREVLSFYCKDNDLSNITNNEICFPTLLYHILFLTDIRTWLVLRSIELWIWKLKIRLVFVLVQCVDF